MTSIYQNHSLINVVPKSKSLTGLMDSRQRKLYEDQYAMFSFVDSIPCVKVRLTGVPRSSEHYQFVQHKLLEYIRTGMKNYCRLHLLTDSSKAGLVLDEDVSYYKMNIVPAMEKAGIRYHAVVLPDSLLIRLIINEITLSTKKLKVQYFNSARSAATWLKSC